MTLHCFRSRLFVMAFVIALVAVSARAQVANNTALVGNVVDASGLAISGAKVTAVNEDTKVVYPGTTNAEGFYSITFIAPGTYDITVAQSGFKELTKTGEIVPIDQMVRTDFKLQVGSEKLWSLSPGAPLRLQRTMLLLERPTTRRRSRICR